MRWNFIRLGRKFILFFHRPFYRGWISFYLPMDYTQKRPWCLWRGGFVSIISHFGAVMDYAFTFSSTFSTHQNKHKASDWFIDRDQVKISELSRRKAAGFRSVRRRNQIICPQRWTCFTCRILSSSSSLLMQRDQCQRAHQSRKRSFRWRFASSFQRLPSPLLQCNSVHTTLISDCKIQAKICVNSEQSRRYFPSLPVLCFYIQWLSKAQSWLLFVMNGELCRGFVGSQAAQGRAVRRSCSDAPCWGLPFQVACTFNLDSMNLFTMSNASR